MSFFDTTPAGRIINRFSKGKVDCISSHVRVISCLTLGHFCIDMDTVDNDLMMAMRSYLTTILSVCSTIVVVSTVTPVFTACLIPILGYYYMQQQFFTVRVPGL